MRISAKKLVYRIKTVRLADYYELTKPGITFLVLISMLMGFLMGSVHGIDYLTLLHACIGTYLIAAGTAAHNQFIERKLDRMMNRTNNRPLPENRISAKEGFIFSMILMMGGLAYLLLMVNWVAGIISAATTIIYLGAYTPMKRITAMNVIIGAVPGALPPVGGWAAASGSISSPGVWLLFAVVFFWQVPHVLSIAWLCNDDYNKAGFQMLPSNDAEGKKTSAINLLFLTALIPTTYLIFTINMGEALFLIGGMFAALGYLYYGIGFALSRSKENSKKLMFASFIYLPVVWILLFLDMIV